MSGSTATMPREALELNESIGLLEAASSGVITRPDGSTIQLGYDGDGNEKPGGVFDAQGRVPIHIIRPGLGRGRGRHYYPGSMLAEAAGAQTFTGWKMYVDHLSPEARKAAGGLPRGVRDLGGRVQETWWDANVPPDELHEEAGAVVGMVRPVSFIRGLIDDDPALVEASISASATSVQPITKANARAWLVEGIQKRGSVDWVTEGGAGGRVVPLLEASYRTDADVELALVESLDPDELREYLRDRATSPSAAAPTNPPEGGDVSEITAEALGEALAANPTVLTEAFQNSGEAQAFVATLVEAKFSEERELLEANAQDRVDRAFELAALERKAHSLIRESKLPESWQEGLFKRYKLDEANRPTPGLDVKNDEEGDEPKSAEVKLTEAVSQDIADEKRRLAEAKPTRVRGGGARQLSESDGGDPPTDKPETPYWAQVLSEAGIEDPEKIYAQP